MQSPVAYRCHAAAAVRPEAATIAAPPAAARQRHRRPRRLLPRAALPPGLADAAGSPSGGAAADLLRPLTSVVQALEAHPREALAAEGLVVALGAYVAAAWADRPRGWSKSELLEVRESPVAGKGVFAAAAIPAGTVLGAYPGRPRGPAQMASKCEAAPAARDYCFRTRTGALLDPTDAAGALSQSPAPGLPWLPVDVTLAYVNEPPLGAGGCSVSVEDDPSDACGLLCVAVRDIAAGEEIYMDYGTSYDRSRYGQQAAGGGARRGGARRGDER